MSEKLISVKDKFSAWLDQKRSEKTINLMLLATLVPCVWGILPLNTSVVSEPKIDGNGRVSANTSIIVSEKVDLTQLNQTNVTNNPPLIRIDY